MGGEEQNDARQVKTDPDEPRNLRDVLDQTPLIKAHLIDRGNLPTSNVIEAGVSKRFATHGALVPPFEPDDLCALFRVSNSLRPNIDAYQTNIDGFGHRFEPIINLESEDADEQVKNALFLDSLHDSNIDPRDVDVDDAKKLIPSDEEVEKAKEQIKLQMRLEKAWLQNFFDFCCPDISFSQLRQQSRQDREVIGWGVWEVLRNDSGEVAQFNYLPAFSIRLMPLDKPVEVEMRVRISDLSFEEVAMQRRFRRFIQVFEDQEMFFKEFGDPRVISKKTGQIIPTNDKDEAQFEDEEDGPATELLYFPIHNPESAYGVPRWIGNLLSVIGSRQSEEVNFLYFDGKGVPPMAILISGGKLSGNSVERIQDFIKNNIKGRKNFHSVMVLEAETASSKQSENAGRVKIEMKPLTAAQHNDALFQNYDERNIDKVGMSFRLPRMLRGDIRDFNRSCYSEDTETLTENGWKRWYEIGEGEKIAAFNPSSAAIEFVVPTEKLVYPVVNEEMWRFENTHTDCLVTHDHKMLVRSAQTRASHSPWETFEASKIPYDRFEVQLAAAQWKGHELNGFELLKVDACSIERGHSHAKAIVFDDWLEFLGYFVSEGGLLVTDHPAAPYLVYIDQKKPRIREKMRACFDRIGWTYSVQEKSCGTTHFLFSNRCLRDWLIKNVGTHSHDKRLPSDYLNLSSRQLRILFDALLDGDGSRDPRENRTALAYYSASSVLAGQVQRIAIQLGLRASVGPGAGVLRVMMSEHRITRLQATRQARTPASITRERYSGMVYCFSVPRHGFFVTRRNGKIAIQGNTADAALAFAEMQVFQPERQDFDFMINRRLLLNEFGIRYWKYVSNAPVTRDPAVVAKMIKDLMNSNAVTALDMRPLLEEVFNREFRTITADWAKQPVPLTVAGIQTGEGGEIVTEGEGEDPDATPEAEAEAFGDMLDLLEEGGGELLDMADLTTGGPGTLAPAQDGDFGGPFSNARRRGRRRFRVLPPQIKSNIERALASYELDRQAVALIKLREYLRKAMEAEAEAVVTGADATD